MKIGIDDPRVQFVAVNIRENLRDKGIAGIVSSQVIDAIAIEMVRLHIDGFRRLQTPPTQTDEGTNASDQTNYCVRFEDVDGVLDRRKDIPVPTYGDSVTIQNVDYIVTKKIWEFWNEPNPNTLVIRILLQRNEARARI